MRPIWPNLFRQTGQWNLFDEQSRSDSDILLVGGIGSHEETNVEILEL